MRRLLPLLIISLSVHCAFAQQKDLVKIADSISDEGKALYKSEWASWYGTDIFVDKCKARRAIAGGYLSYDSGKGLVNIFFSKEADPKVLSTISFGYDYNSNNYKLDTTDRKFTPSEAELYALRKNAIARISNDTTFKTYRNTELNPVPIVRDNLKRVYVLTGTNAHGEVLFGNDYLLEFDNERNITSTKKLHKGLIPIQFGSDTTKSKIQLAAIHTHLPEYSEFITATDICTLMLYENFSTWNQHIVISRDYVSIWDCKRNNLTILTQEAWKKINPGKNALENNSH